MATRGTIAIQREDGTVAQIYSHWDNYLEGNGALLVNHYTDPAKIEALIAEGDISSLDREVGERHQFSSYTTITADEGATYDEAEAKGWTTFYGRDRGEKNTKARVFKDVEDYETNYQPEEFNYFFIEGRWYYKSYDGLVRDVEKQLIWEAISKKEAA